MDARLPAHALFRAWMHQARLLAHTWEDAQLLRSHAFLARRAVRRAPYAHCIRCIRALAHANCGWPHAVARALAQAYGRAGRLRHALLDAALPRHAAAAAPGESRALRRMRDPEIGPLLHALIYSPAARSSAPPARNAHITPPRLARAEAIVRGVPGKRLARRRIANIRWHWVSEQARRIHPPLGYVVNGHADLALVHALEARVQAHAKPAPRAATTTPPPYILAASRAMREWSTQSPARPARALGWARRTRDFAGRRRSRRRMLAHLLARAPIAHVAGEVEVAARGRRGARAPGALGALARRVRAVGAPDARVQSVRLTLSPHAHRRGAPRACATPEELAWLGSSK